MAYVITKSDGTTLVAVEDGSINTSVSPLTLIGRNYSGFGQSINQNFVRMTENFAHNVQPTNPLRGQLWYDTSSKTLKAYSGSRFKSLAYVDSATTSPSDPVSGSLWFNEVEQKLYFYNGSTYVLVGPQFTGLASNNLVLPAELTDTGRSYYVLKYQIEDTITQSLNTVAIVSENDFTPTGSISGFPTIKKGITLYGTNQNGISTDTIIWGTASNATKLNGYADTDFVKASTPTFASEVNIVTNTAGTGINVNSGALRLYLNPNDNSVANITAGKGSTLKFNVLSGTSLLNAITVSASSGLALLPSTDLDTGGTTIGSNDYRFNNVYTAGLDAGYDNTLRAPKTGVYRGQWTGTSGSTWALAGADLAERYHADANYEVGTVLIVGGDNEVTQCDDIRQNIAGIVSTNPAYMLNADAGPDSTHPYIALKGRVPCKVTGRIFKGDMLVSSKVPGHAKAALYTAPEPFLPSHIVGIALEDFEGDSGVIEVKV